MGKFTMPDVNQDFTSLVQALIDHTSSVIYVKDVDLRYLLINQQFANQFHVSRDEIVGKTDFDLFSPQVAEWFRLNDQLVLESGESMQFEEVAPHDDGQRTYLSLKFPLRDPEGLIYAVASISSDVTERIRDQQEIASLQCRQHLILDSVGDGICQLDALGLVVFLNPAAERMLQWGTSELRGQCHSKIVMSRMPIAWTPSALERGARSRSMNLKNGTADTHVCAANFRRRDGSVLPVEYTMAPIYDRESVVGAVVAFRDTSDRLKQIAIEQEIQTARRIQLSHSPKKVPEIPGFEFAAVSIPCSKACGDYFDFIEWGQDRLGIAVGDVSGHGLGAALEMVETRAILRTTMSTENSPVECLTRLNKFLAQDLPDDMFVTLFLAALDTRTRTLTYAAGGHDALLLRANGDLIYLESTGTVLGWNEEAEFSGSGLLSLRSGDLLLIATDGIAESVSPARQLFGRERIVAVLRKYRSLPAAEILHALLMAAEAFREREHQRDDVTAVVLKIL